MTTTTISSREFNQDAGGAKKAADKGPVIITDRGKPAHVLLSFEDYQKLLGKGLACGCTSHAGKMKISNSIPRGSKARSRSLWTSTDVFVGY